MRRFVNTGKSILVHATGSMQRRGCHVDATSRRFSGMRATTIVLTVARLGAATEAEAAVMGTTAAIDAAAVALPNVETNAASAVHFFLLV